MASRLLEMQARFQQKQMQEKEEKLLKLYETQQQRAFDRVGRGSAGSDTNITLNTGKVRQMFDERRQKAGIDRSYPLEPLKNNRNIQTNRAASLDRKNVPIKSTVKTSLQKTVSSTRNGKPLINKREVMQSVYNNNGGEETYESNQYVDDEADNYLKEHRDIVEMMNNQNLTDSLDDEELPRIGFDELDDTAIFAGKLPNVGKLASQNVVTNTTNTNKKVATKPATKTVSSPVTKPTTKTIGSPVKKEAKPIIKQASRPRPPSAKSTGSGSSSAQSSPSHSTKMNNKQGGDRMGSSAKPSVRSQIRPGNAVVQRDDLTACRYCQRRFATDRLQTHEDICSRTGKKKRKAFDATKHRVAGTELEPYTRGKGIKGSGKNSTANESTKTKAGTKQVKPTSSKSNWRQKHEEFISAIRAAKQVQAHVAKGGNLKDLPPPPPSTNPDYVQCPHCGRRFNETAAERHIPKCATYQYNKPKAGSKTIPPGNNRIAR